MSRVTLLIDGSSGGETQPIWLQSQYSSTHTVPSLRGPAAHKELLDGTLELPWSDLMVGEGVRVRDLRPWPKNDEVRTFPF